MKKDRLAVEDMVENIEDFENDIMEEFNIAEEAFQDKMGDKPFSHLNKPGTSLTLQQGDSRVLCEVSCLHLRPSKSMSESTEQHECLWSDCIEIFKGTKHLRQTMMEDNRTEGEKPNA